MSSLRDTLALSEREIAATDFENSTASKYTMGLTRSRPWSLPPMRERAEDAYAKPR
jgi:hypothetical protein